MTTSYSKNIFTYQICLHTLGIQVSLSSCMSIKTGLSDFLLYNYSDFWFYRSWLHYEKFKKKSGENKNKLRTVYPKNYEQFKNSKPSV